MKPPRCANLLALLRRGFYRFVTSVTYYNLAPSTARFSRGDQPLRNLEDRDCTGTSVRLRINEWIDPGCQANRNGDVEKITLRSQLKHKCDFAAHCGSSDLGRGNDQRRLAGSSVQED